MRASSWCLRGPVPARLVSLFGTGFAAVLSGWAGVAVVGCGSIEPVAPYDETITDPARLYTKLTLNHRAITLSTDATDPAYHTLQLVATPRDARGNPMAELSAPTFRSLDPARVEVSPTGLLMAKAATGGVPVEVIAELTEGLVLRADTARINVTTTLSPPQLTTLSVQPVSPDSAVRAVMPVRLVSSVALNWVGTLIWPSLSPVPSRVPSARAADPAGASIPGVLVEYVSIDSVIGIVGRWDRVLDLRRPGQLRVVARAMAYGVAKEDTLALTVTMPIGQNVFLMPGPTGAPVLEPREVRIAPYGIMVVSSFIDDPVDVTFDDAPPLITPPAVICGVLDEVIAFAGPGPTCTTTADLLVPPISRDPVWEEFFEDARYGSYMTLQVRQFTTPGVYRFHSDRLGVSGRVVVSADVPQDAPGAE